MNQPQSNRTSANPNPDVLTASLVATLKQHIADLEAEAASMRRELNAAKETLRKLEQIVGSAERFASPVEAASSARNTSRPSEASRLIEPIHPTNDDKAPPTEAASDTLPALPPIAQRVRNITDKLIKRFGIDESEQR